MDFDHDLDVKGLKCPLPILRTKKALADMAPGKILRVTATDPSALKDFKAFTTQTGHQLLASTEPPADEFVFLIRRK